MTDEEVHAAVAQFPVVIREAHDHAMDNRLELKASQTAGCFYCLRRFVPAAIEGWVDGGSTALCPYCGVDSVLGDAAGYLLTRTFLKDMKDYWFAPAPYGTNQQH